MKVEAIIKPCPWCKKTPELFMPIPQQETWRWHIACIQPGCAVKPRSQHVNFRNTSKKDLRPFLRKITGLVEGWNGDLDTVPYEKKIIDCSKIKSLFSAVG